MKGTTVSIVGFEGHLTYGSVGAGFFGYPLPADVYAQDNHSPLMREMSSAMPPAAFTTRLNLLVLRAD
jgi:hypothetical protein